MGNPRFQITVEELDGWARVKLAQGEPTGEVARYLSDSLNAWMKKNPKLKVKHIVPITSNGDTSELHVWYEHAD